MVWWRVWEGNLFLGERLFDSSLWVSFALPCSLWGQILEGSEGGVAGWGGRDSLHFARRVCGGADAAEAAVQQIWRMTERKCQVQCELWLWKTAAISQYIDSWWEADIWFNSLSHFLHFALKYCFKVKLIKILEDSSLNVTFTYTFPSPKVLPYN